MNDHLQATRGRLFKSAVPAAAGRERRMAMTDVTNLFVELSPPNIVRTVKACDDFEDLVYAPASKAQYQYCSPPWSHHGEQQPPYQRRASHRRLHAMDWDGIISTNQAYSSRGDVNVASRPNPARTFEQLHANTLTQRMSRSSDFLSSHTTLHTQRYQSSVSSSSREVDDYNQVSQDNSKPACKIPSNISDLISDLNSKAKLLSRDEDEYDDSSSLEYSSDDSMIEAAIYKSVAPRSTVKQQQHLTCGKTMKDLICAVCLDLPDDPKHIATVSGCTHRFCFGCIDKWARRGNNECPLCKSTFHLIASGDRVRWY